MASRAPPRPQPHGETTRIGSGDFDRVIRRTCADTALHLLHACGKPMAAVHVRTPSGWLALGRQGHEPEADSELDAFLEYAVATADVMIVPDSGRDARFAAKANIRFFAGRRITSSRGAAVGVVSVFDRQPGELSDAQALAISLSARQISTLFELRGSRQQQDQIQNIIDSLPGVFYLFDQQARFLRWNRRFEEVSGYDSSAFSELSPLDLFDDADRALVAESIDETFRKGASEVEVDLVSREGRRLPFYFTGHRVELRGQPCIVGMGLDLSARRRAEGERDRLFNLSPDLLCILDVDGRFLELNPAWEQTLGFPREELLVQPALDLVHPDDQQALRAELLQRKTGPVHVTTRLRTAAGQWRWFAWHGSAGPSRELRYAVARDITKEKTTAQALAASEARYRSLVESARDAIVVIRDDGTIDSANRAFQGIFGYEPTTWVGHRFDRLVYPDDLPRALQALGQLDSEHHMPVFELRVVTRDGTTVPVEIQGTQVRLEGDTVGALVIARDVRQRKALDNRLQRVQRLDAIGQLAAGVAHDFNNLLQIVHGEVDLLLAHPMLSPQVKDGLEQIDEASTRAARITRKLLLLSREHEWHGEALDLNDVVTRFLPMLKRLLGTRHELEWHPASETPMVLGDLGMLEQVLMNLIINARDAMPEGGTVTISSRVVDLDPERAMKEPDVESGTFVQITVADTGTGIAPEHLPHLFEPLFTTKPVGEGTGLGLATLYGIVRRHHGWVEVDSTPGEGARFLLHFPVAES
ncbi:MAG: PAS domain-containing sensor histidine kinase [Gammaproteobacteria bacterium]|nr:MAG: PAS domain-containing sensor histidine kinase [Gammaproteobacteria bacterium]